MNSQTEMTLEHATAEAFTPFLGKQFDLSLEEGGELVVPLELTTALRIGPSTRPFSLMFSGSIEIPLNQGVYWISNEDLGSLPIFIVPVREDAERRYYEAIFN
jgi:hypothetical protein